MRRITGRAATMLPVVFTVAALTLTACNDRSSVTGPRPDFAPVFSAAPGSSLDEEIAALIAQAFSGGHQTVVTSRWNAIKANLSSGQDVVAKKQLVQLVDWIREKTPEMNAAALPATEATAHAATRLTYYMSLYVYGGAAVQQAPPPPLGGDVASQIVQPMDTTTVVTPAQQAGVNFDAGSVAEPTIVVVAEDPRHYERNCSGPLDTKLCQYPKFYHFDAFPHSKLLKPAHFAVCMITAGGTREPFNQAVHERMRLAHEKPADPVNYTPGSTIQDNIEILPKTKQVMEHFTSCEEPTNYSLLPSGASSQRDASWGVRLLTRLASAASRMLTPRSAYAYDQGPEHDALFFSAYGGVDTLSQPDLAVDQLSVSASALGPGDSLQVSYRVTNTSPASGGVATETSDSVRVAIHLIGADATNEGADIVLASDSVFSPLAPDESFAVTKQRVLVPPTLPAGQYNVRVAAIPSASIAEVSTTNNAAVAALTVRPRLADLSIISGVSVTGPRTPSTTLYPGDSLTINQFTVGNAGAPSAPTTVAIYLSSDPVIDVNDVPLAAPIPLPAIPSGDSSGYNPTIVYLPQALAPGTYYLGALVDGGNAVPESNESNNTAAAQITVSVPPGTPTIGVSANSVSLSVQQGKTASTPMSIANVGGGILTGIVAGPFSNYFNGDQAPWVSGTLNSTTAPATLTITASPSLQVPAGTYQLRFDIVAPGATNTPYTIYSVNVTVIAADVTPTGATISPSASELFITAVQGSSGSAQMTVSNSGTGTLTGLAVSPLTNYFTGELTPWVSASLNTTTAPAIITVTASPTTATPPGDYQLRFDITSPGATNSPVTIYSVHVTVQAPPEH
ncbi:MAG: CARDB domain-containing protein [Gemmatimonadaceae bacterium]